MSQSSIEQITNLLTTSSLSNAHEASYGHHSIMGTRKTNKLNEDNFEYIAVSKLPDNLTPEKASEAVRNTFTKIVAGCANHTDGATLSLAFVYPTTDNEKILTVGSLGDSSIFLIICDENNQIRECALINQHHLQSNPNEVKRLFLLGGHILEKSDRGGRSLRLNKILQTYRSAGDKAAKKGDHLRIDMPDIHQVKIPAAWNAYLVATSDGFTDATAYAGNENHPSFLFSCLKDQLNTNKSLNDIAKEVCQSSNALITQNPENKTDDTTVLITRMGEDPFCIAIFDGHGANEKLTPCINNTTNYIKDNLAAHFNDSLFVNNSNENNNTISNTATSPVNYLINDTEWKTADTISSRIADLPKKIQAYPVIDSWLDSLSEKEMENFVTNIFLFVLKDTMTSGEDVLLAAIYQPGRIKSLVDIKTLMLKAMEKKEAPKDILSKIYRMLYINSHRIAGTQAGLLFDSLKLCALNKNINNISFILNSTLFKKNATNFSIFINNIHYILSILDLTKHPESELTEIFALINRRDRDLYDMVEIINKLSILNESLPTLSEETKVVVGKGLSKMSGFLNNLSSKNSFLKTISTTIAPNVQNQLKNALSIALKNTFREPIEIVMAKLKNVLQDYNISLNGWTDIPDEVNDNSTAEVMTAQQ